MACCSDVPGCSAVCEAQAEAEEVFGMSRMVVLACTVIGASDFPANSALALYYVRVVAYL